MPPHNLKSESPPPTTLANIPLAPPPSPTQASLTPNQSHWVEAQELLALALEYLALAVETVADTGETADLAAREVEERSGAARERWQRAKGRVVAAAASLRHGSGAGRDEDWGRDQPEENVRLEQGERHGVKRDIAQGKGEDGEERGKRKRSVFSPLPDRGRVRRPRL